MTLDSTITHRPAPTSWLAGRLGPAGWFCIAVILVFGVRAVTTLAAGGDWHTPGTGWRSLWQLIMVAVAVAGLIWQSRIRVAVGVIGATYLVASILELFDGTTLLGVIPVDARDRFIHPLVAVLAAVVLVVVGIAKRRKAATRP
jgi:hypothetical protein